MTSGLIDITTTGAFRIRRRAFTDADVLARERTRIFDRSWLYLGHESEIAGPGAFCARDVAGRPLVMVRGDDGAVRVFFNACAHRGAQVCVGSGTTKTFQCPYHGWTYGTDGSLTGVPGEEAYDGCLERAALGLRRPARVESYRGFMFVSFQASAPPLATFLGEATYYLDLICDQGDDLEVVPGVHQYEIRANWKLMVENSIDIYHLPTVHKRFVDFIRSRSDGQRWAPRLGRGRDLGNGHAAVENPPTSGRTTALWHPDYGEETRPWIEATRARFEERYGAERAALIAETNRNLFIFPNLAIIDAAGITVRTFFPLAPDRMAVRAWALAPRGEPDNVRSLRMKNYVTFLAPGGFGAPDDGAIIESCQRSFAADPEAWSDVSRGIRRTEPLHTDEEQIRAFWRQWDRALGSEDFDGE
jgi:p-cumate 2,3-dioxygenase subunit alpha